MILLPYIFIYLFINFIGINEFVTKEKEKLSGYNFIRMRLIPHYPFLDGMEHFNEIPYSLKNNAIKLIYKRKCELFIIRQLPENHIFTDQLLLGDRRSLYPLSKDQLLADQL